MRSGTSSGAATWIRCRPSGSKLAAAWDAARNRPGDHAVWSDLEACAHRLSGSAASYALPAVAAAASELEQLVTDAAATEAQMQDAVEALDRVLVGASGPTSR